MNITTGKQQGAIRAVFYGTEGIGKSTLASQLPDALIIDTEDGTKQIDCARALCLGWREIETAIKELINTDHGYKTVIIDSADWLEKSLIDFMLKQTGKKSIEDYGYGKGYTILQEHVVRFLGLVDQLIAKGIHVVFVAHAKVARVSPPDQTDGYDRYELKMTKQVAPLLKEWCDLLLFCNYKIHIVEGTDGRLKAQGGKERTMYAERSAAWDAKNRFGLQEEMPMTIEQILPVFSGSAPRAAAPAAAPAAVQEKKPAVVVNKAAPSFATSDQIDLINKLQPKHVALVEAVIERENVVGVDELTHSVAEELLAEMQAVPAAFPEKIAKWLAANSEKVTDYLVSIKWLTQGQTYSELSAENIAKIIDRTPKFARAAGLKWEAS